MPRFYIHLLVFCCSFLFFLQACNEGEPAKNKTEIIPADPLPSWNDGDNKKRIIDFVEGSADSANQNYIPAAERIACFDNDGTLWSEQPYYFQLGYVIDNIKTLAPQHPEWKTKQPFKALLAGDMKTVLGSGETGLLALVNATHSGITADAFNASVKNWIDTAIHPVTKKHYKEMVYQPMLELLRYLRSNDYKTFIVSGGGIDFMRAWAEKVYGIPPYQVVGSSGKVQYEIQKGKPVIMKTGGLAFNDDKEGKPVGIYQHIGMRPVFTAGNSDGDFAMLQYTTAGSGQRLGIIVHHTDSVREFAYDRKSAIGHLDKAMDSAVINKWLLIDMKNDWKKIYP